MLTKKKVEKTQITSNRHEKRDITIGPMANKMTIIDHYEEFYAPEIDLMIELPNFKSYYKAAVIKTVILVKE